VVDRKSYNPETICNAELAEVVIPRRSSIVVLTRRLFLLVPVVLLFASAATSSSEKASDEAGIRAAVIAFQEAWNHHDMKAMTNVFTEDADLINVVGTRWQGRANIVKALGVFHREMFKNEQIHFEEMTIRSLTPNVAVAVAVQTGSGEMVLPDGLGPRKPMGEQLDTFVVVKRDGAWKVAHGQNTTVNADAQAFDPIKTNWNGEIPK
jgi:uncharacterized protein (TIGR02246 family)